MKKFIIGTIMLVCSSFVHAQGAKPPTLTPAQQKEIADAYNKANGLTCEAPKPVVPAKDAKPAARKRPLAPPAPLVVTTDPEDGERFRPGKSVDFTVKATAGVPLASFRAECDDGCVIGDIEPGGAFKHGYTGKKTFAVTELFVVKPKDKVKGGKGSVTVKVTTATETKKVPVEMTWAAEEVLPPPPPPAPKTVCEGGSVLPNGECICKNGVEPRKIADGHYVCESPPAPVVVAKPKSLCESTGGRPKVDGRCECTTPLIEDRSATGEYFCRPREGKDALSFLHLEGGYRYRYRTAPIYKHGGHYLVLGATADIMPMLDLFAEFGLLGGPGTTRLDENGDPVHRSKNMSFAAGVRYWVYEKNVALVAAFDHSALGITSRGSWTRAFTGASIGVDGKYAFNRYVAVAGGADVFGGRYSFGDVTDQGIGVGLHLGLQFFNENPRR